MKDGLRSTDRNNKKDEAVSVDSSVFTVLRSHKATCGNGECLLVYYSRL